MAEGEPFDVDAYNEVIRELTLAIQEANTPVLSTERAIGAETPIVDIFDRVLCTGTSLVVILCIASFFRMLDYRGAIRRLVAERGRPHVRESLLDVPCSGFVRRHGDADLRELRHG